MFEVLFRRQFAAVLNSIIPFSLRLSYSDSALIQSQLKLKALVEEDFSRVEKKDFKKHFIENLFLNKFQNDVLEYPELDTKEEVRALKKYFVTAQKLLTSEVDDKNVNCEDLEAVSILKKLELSGLKLSKMKNGFGCLSSEYTFMQEALSLKPSLSKTVTEHEDFGIQLIDSFGSDTQKKQYLLKLITGENIACFAHLEPSKLVSFEQDSLSTVAVPSSDNQSYIISGLKSWVYNAKNADVFILSANIENVAGGKIPKTTLFLVDRNTSGIEIHQPIEKIGLKNLNICDVSFDKVVVPSHCILGNLNQGGEIISSVLSKGKLNNGGQCIAIMKKFINKAIQHCVLNEFFEKDKCEKTYFRNKIAHMVSQLYAVESMTYLVTGRLDSHNDADVFLESLIVKIFASDTLQFITQQALEILGPEFFSDDEDLGELSMDAKSYIACDDANDYLRLILSSTGLKHAIESKRKSNIFRKVFGSFKIESILKHLYAESYFYGRKDLKGYLHLMFSEESLLLENGIYNLYLCTNYLTKKYGMSIFERHVELIYLADIAINIYAMTAILGRASRAYCVGVRLNEVDRLCAATQVSICALRLQKKSDLIFKFDYRPKITEIGSKIMDCSKYSDLYSVTRNLKIRQ